MSDPLFLRSLVISALLLFLVPLPTSANMWFADDCTKIPVTAAPGTDYWVDTSTGKTKELPAGQSGKPCTEWVPLAGALGDIEGMSTPGADGTAPVASSGSLVMIDVAEQSELDGHAGTASGVHVVSANVVVTTDAQTLTQKTVNDPIINSLDFSLSQGHLYIKQDPSLGAGYPKVIYDSEYPSLSAALADCAAGKTLVIREGWIPTSNVTLQTCWFVFDGGYFEEGATDITITKDAGTKIFHTKREQIFRNFEAGDIIIEDPKELYPVEYWGAKGDNSTDNCRALSNALASFVQPSGFYDDKIFLSFDYGFYKTSCALSYTGTRAWMRLQGRGYVLGADDFPMPTPYSNSMAGTILQFTSNTKGVNFSPSASSTFESDGILYLGNGLNSDTGWYLLNTGRQTWGKNGIGNFSKGFRAKATFTTQAESLELHGNDICFANEPGDDFNNNHFDFLSLKGCAYMGNFTGGHNKADMVEMQGNTAGDGLVVWNGSWNFGEVWQESSTTPAFLEDELVDGDGSAGTSAAERGDQTILFPSSPLVSAASQGLCANSLSSPTRIWHDSGKDCDVDDGDTHTALVGSLPSGDSTSAADDTIVTNAWSFNDEDTDCDADGTGSDSGCNVSDGIYDIGQDLFINTVPSRVDSSLEDDDSPRYNSGHAVWAVGTAAGGKPTKIAGGTFQNQGAGTNFFEATGNGALLILDGVHGPTNFKLTSWAGSPCGIIHLVNSYGDLSSSEVSGSCGYNLIALNAAPSDGLSRIRIAPWQVGYYDIQRLSANLLAGGIRWLGNDGSIRMILGHTTGDGGVAHFYNSSSTPFVTMDGETNRMGVNTPSPARDAHITDVMRLEPRASPPSSPANGDLYVDTSGALCYYDGRSWGVAAGSGSCR